VIECLQRLTGVYMISRILLILPNFSGAVCLRSRLLMGMAIVRCADVSGTSLLFWSWGGWGTRAYGLSCSFTTHLYPWPP